ncbi:Indoleamine 2,3-dioxygenase [Penicillium camemberti]|uniref:Indoleamine 2,3-dioxygenase n=1 Tax=Penicillium camemberti (strain FM 013) TaxID=1429867 RepID=A0A0G4PI01_PENC3|nr:Indoleamine 2,3-dioxygenase [Penicillium camemberti]
MVNLALGVIFLFVSLRLVTLKTQSSSPPCERIIEEAERTNRRNGHENAGFLSKEAGFSPLQIMKALPPSHAAWDQLVADLPRLIQSQTARDTVTKLPLLDASPEALPDIYLQRAATILGMTAHVFVRMEGSEPLTLKYNGHGDILPPSLEIPWTVVCRRLGRPAPALTYVDGVVANFTSTSSSHSGVTLENLELLVPTVGTKEEHTFIGIMIEINAKTIPILHQIIEAQRFVLTNDSSSLKNTIRSLHSLIKQTTRVLSKLNASRAHKAHIDPVLWTLTVANLGIPWVKGMVGAAGTAHPFFHMMDEFTGRFEYLTGIGQEAQIVRATYPIHWRQFLKAMMEVSVSEYVAASKDRELMDLWKTFTSSYHGNDGLLGFHRRKVFGFLAVSFRIGRSTTINGLGHKRRTEPWHEVDQELEKARLERCCLDLDEHNPDTEPSSNKVFVSQLIQHNSEETGYWFSARGSVYNASTFMQKHPGGDTVITLCSGQDITDSLKAVGHLTNSSIRNKLETYRIGTLEKPKFASSQAEEAYMAAVELGQRAAEVENVHRRNFQLLDGKLTILDKPEVLTPKKARHLLDAKNRLQDEYVPALAMLLDVLLESIAMLDMKLDLNTTHVQMVGLLSPGTGPGTATRFLDYGMVLDTLRKDLGRLTEVKELVAIILGAFEEGGFTCSEQSRLESIAGTLNRIASHLVVLAGK